MKNLRAATDCAWCKKPIADGEPRQTYIPHGPFPNDGIAVTVCLFCYRRLTRMARETREASIARCGR